MSSVTQRIDELQLPSGLTVSIRWPTVMQIIEHTSVLPVIEVGEDRNGGGPAQPLLGDAQRNVEATARLIRACLIQPELTVEQILNELCSADFTALALHVRSVCGVNTAIREVSPLSATGRPS